MLTAEDREAIREIVDASVARVLSATVKMALEKLELIRADRAGKIKGGETEDVTDHACAVQ